MYTILLPAYNCESSLTPCIESILDDVGDEARICVVNNNSSDRTQAIVDTLAARHGSLISLYEPTQGVSHALNAGLQFIRRGWVARMDSDDVWLPGRHKHIKSTISSNRYAKTIYGTSCIYRKATDAHSKYGLVDPHNNWHPMDWSIHFTCPFIHPTVLYRADQILSIGGYPTFFPQCEDYHLWVTCYIHGFRLMTSSIRTVAYTLDTGVSTSSANRNLQLLGHDAAMYRAFRHTLRGDVRISTVQIIRSLLITSEYTNAPCTAFPNESIKLAISAIRRLELKYLSNIRHPECLDQAIRQQYLLRIAHEAAQARLKLEAAISQFL